MEFLSRSWKVMEFDVDKYVCSGAAYCSGLSEIYAGKHVKLRQDINLLWRTMFPRVPVAKLYYRHSDLTSTVRGRWQHSYYNALCRNVSFTVWCKSNQWITALWRRVLPANNVMAESCVGLVSNESVICWRLRSITCSHDPNCTEFNSYGCCALRLVRARSTFFHGGRDECDMLRLGCRRCRWRLPVFAAV